MTAMLPGVTTTTTKAPPAHGTRQRYQAGCTDAAACPAKVTCSEANAAYRRERYHAAREAEPVTERERTVPVSTRLSEAEHAEVAKVAKRRRMSMSRAVRVLVVEGLAPKD